MKGPQFQKSKMVNHVRTCGADVGDAPRCILTGQRVIFKQMPQMAPKNHQAETLYWRTAADDPPHHPP